MNNKIVIEKEDKELMQHLLSSTKPTRTDIDDCLKMVKKYIYKRATVCYSCQSSIQSLFKYIRVRKEFFVYE